MSEFLGSTAHVCNLKADGKDTKTERLVFSFVFAVNLLSPPLTHRHLVIMKK